jgi:uncharacterized protein (UPF0371 family)
METIFDYNPTEQELVGIYYKTENDYKANTNNDMIIADLAILFADRNQQKKSNEYWAKIPELHQEFLLGFDNVEIPVK